MWQQIGTKERYKPEEKGIKARAEGRKKGRGSRRKDEHLKSGWFSVNWLDPQISIPCTYIVLSKTSSSHPIKRTRQHATNAGTTTDHIQNAVSSFIWRSTRIKAGTIASENLPKWESVGEGGAGDINLSHKRWSLVIIKGNIGESFLQLNFISESPVVSDFKWISMVWWSAGCVDLTNNLQDSSRLTPFAQGMAFTR